MNIAKAKELISKYRKTSILAVLVVGLIYGITNKEFTQAVTENINPKSAMPNDEIYCRFQQIAVLKEIAINETSQKLAGITDRDIMRYIDAVCVRG